MRWSIQGEYVLVSNTMPAYKVSKFYVDGRTKYRASFKGEFIGAMSEERKAAQVLCERHHSITGEAKEDTNGGP